MKSLLTLPLVLAGIVFFTGCKKDDPPLPDNTINFTTSELGFESAESAKAIALTIDRAATTVSTVKLTLTEEGLVYGTDYTTSPAAENGELTVTIPAGQTTATVTVSKVSGALFVGDEKLTLSIGTPSAGIVKGNKESLALTFGAIISTKGELTLNGGEGGPWAVNSVFVDLSNNEQTSVARSSWNLGFYCGDGFAVKLNGTLKSSAKEAGIGIDAIVSSADSATYAAALVVSGGSAAEFNVIDSWTGDLSKTVIKEGKVYVVNPGAAPLYKVKVTLKDANTYTVQYAKINESKVTSIDVAKNSAFNFKFISFSAGKEVTVEPAKAKWDIMWSNFLYHTYNAAASADVPYLFPDVVIINSKAGVQVAEVASDAEKNAAAYAALTLAGASQLTFSSNVDAIGSKWRVTPNVKDDRFYVVKDPAGNYYKLMFTSMGDTRGYPKLKYELLK